MENLNACWIFGWEVPKPDIDLEPEEVPKPDFDPEPEDDTVIYD